MRYVKYKNEIKDKIITTATTTSLVCKESGKVTPVQLEWVRRIINKMLNKTGKIIWKVKADKVLTKKPLGVPQGGGKGKFASNYDAVSTGQVIVVVIHKDKKIVRKALEKVQIKLGVKTIICQ